MNTELLLHVVSWAALAEWPSITLPPNNLPLKMATTNLRYSEMPINCRDSPVVIRE